MPTSHTAYGLRLQTSFPLPGMRPSDDASLPALALELLAPEQLLAAWSGSGQAPAWTGQLGDGCLLHIERGRHGDVLISYGDRARFRLDARATRLECAPLQAGLHWQQALLSRVLPNVAILRGYEALHASAVASPDGVVAILGPSGVGKSTLAVELAMRGWPLFTDDVLILGTGEAGIRAYPGTPHTKLADEDAASDREPWADSLGVLAGERWMALRESALQPHPVRLICLLDRAGDRDGGESEPLPSTPLPLGPYMLGFPWEAERERQRFALYADLMGATALVRIERGRCSASELADSIERALGELAATAGESRLATGAVR